MNVEDDKFWIVKKKGLNVCCVLFNDSDPDSFTVWVCGDHIGGRVGADVDEEVKEAAWMHVFNSCGNCGSGCSPEDRRRTIFGMTFDDICTAELTVALLFENPGGETLGYLKQIADIRKNDIINNI